MESHFWPQNEISNTMCHAIHVDENLGALQSGMSNHYIIDNFYEEYHTFGMMWTPKEYIFYIDGLETWRTNHYKGVSQVKEYLKISVEVSGQTMAPNPPNGELMLITTH